MTPKEFKKTRNTLGLSQAKLARKLGIKNARTIRKWEAGENKIPGPAAVAIGFILSDTQEV